MPRNEFTPGNIEIAKFIGCKCNDQFDFIFNGKSYNIHQLIFHESWKWLIQAWEKVKETKVDIQLCKDDFEKGYNDKIIEQSFYATVEAIEKIKAHKNMPLKVISGGQTGVDMIGLVAAKMSNLETGGTAPYRFRTENGSNYDLKNIFKLKEDVSWRYEPRTEYNVQDSDATIIFGNTDEAGTKLTIKLLKKHKKPYLLNPSVLDITVFLDKHKIQVLNIAGNRGSKLTPEQKTFFGKILLKAFKIHSKYHG